MTGAPVAECVQVHPRACGGNDVRWFRKHSERGPSPRVRGKPFRPSRSLFRRRSIPARAGETTRHAVRNMPTQVHPRACGGNFSGLSSPLSAAGPSPRVRGKLRTRKRRGAPRGSIPARAGETYRSTSRLRSTGVHPRACGGNGMTQREYEMQQRSIPARAGETGTTLRIYSGSAVHPRACGGNRHRDEVLESHEGPSPRVRGKLVRGRDEDRLLRSIPARAGETRPQDA